MIYEYVCHFKSNTKHANCCPAIFNLRLELGVNNPLMVAEIKPKANKLSLFYGETLSKEDRQ